MLPIHYTFWQYLSFIKVVTCLKVPIFVRSVLVMHQTKFPNIPNILFSFFFFLKPFFFNMKDWSVLVLRITRGYISFFNVCLYLTAVNHTIYKELVDFKNL